jgi:hypothetical protein
MGFLDSLKSLFTGGGGADESGYWVYVRCRRCGEAIRTRIDLRNDLSPSDEEGYTVTKTLVGDRRCFERIEVTLTFDENRRLLGQEIQRGDFISAEEFEAAQRS